MDYGSVELGFMHVGYRGFSVRGFRVDDVRSATISHDYVFFSQLSLYRSREDVYIVCL